MGLPKVGLEAVLEDQDFQKGVDNYMKSTDDMTSQSDKTGGALGNLGGTIAKLGGIIAGVFAVSKVVDFFKESVEAASEEEQGIIKLGRAVKNTGADWDTASAAIETYLSAELKRTALDDGDGRRSIQALTEATGDYKKALDLMPLAQDLARAKGLDLAAAAKIVGNAVNGNTGTLSRYGIVLKEGATATEVIAALQAKFGGQAEAYGNSYAGAMDKWKVATGNVKETIGKAFLPVLAALATKAAGFATNILPKVEAAMARLKPLFDSVGGAIQTVASAIGTLIGKVQSGISPLMVLQQTFPAIFSPEVTGAIMAIVKPIERLFQAFRAGQSPLMILASTFPQLFTPALQTQIAGVGRAIGLLVDTVGRTLSGALGTLWGLWQTIWPNLLAVARPIWEVLAGAVRTAMGVINQVIGAAGEIWTTVMGIFSEKIVAVRNIVQPIVEAIGAKFMEIFGQIGPFVTGVITTIKDWIADNMVLIRTTIETVLTKVQQFWVKHGEDVLASIQAVWEVIKTAISTAINAVLGIIKAVMQIINGDWEGAWDTMNGVVASIWEGIKKIVTTALNAILGFFDTNLAELATKIAAGASALWQAGKDLLQGFWDGLVDKWNGVKAWIGDTFGKVLPGWVKDLLGIGSPSTVFMQFGIDTMLGFMEGMDEKKRDALEQTTRIVGAIVDVFAAVAGLGGTKLGTLPDMAEWGNRLVTVVQAGMDAINYATNLLTKDALTKASEMADILTKIIGVVTTALPEGKLSKKFPDMAEWHNRLITAITYGVDAICAAAAAVGKPALNKAAKLAENMGKVLGLVSAALPEGKLSKKFPDMAEWHNRLITAITYGVDAIRAAAVAVGKDALKKAAKLAENMGKVLGLVNAALPEGKLSKKFPDMAEWHNRFITAIEKGVDAINAAAAKLPEGALKKAAKLAERMGQILNVVNTTLPEGKLSKAFPDMTKWGDRLVAAITAGVDAINRAAIAVGTDALKAAAKLAEKMGQVLGVVNTALPSEALSEQFPDMAEWGRRLVTVLVAVVAAINDAGTQVGPAALKAAAKLAEKMATVLGVIQPAFDALTTLKSFPGVLDLGTKLAAFTTAMKTMIVDLLAAMTAEGMPSLVQAKAAGKYYAAIIEIVSAVTPASEAINRVIGASVVDIKTLQARFPKFQENVVYLVTAMVGMVGAMEAAGVERAKLFGEHMADIGQAIEDGLDTFNAIKNRAQGGDPHTAVDALWEFVRSVNEALGQAVAAVVAKLDNLATEIQNRIASIANVGYQYGWALGNSISNGFYAGLGQLQTVGVAAHPGSVGNMGSGNTTTQVNLGGLHFAGGVSNQVDVQRLGDYVVQRVREGLRR